MKTEIEQILGEIDQKVVDQLLLDDIVFGQYGIELDGDGKVRVMDQDEVNEFMNNKK